MTPPARFPYIQVAPAQGAAGLMPIVPVVFQRNNVRLTSEEPVDSGSAVNVLPFDVVVQLGFDWNQIPGALSLGGALAGAVAKPVLLDVTLAPFPTVRMGFAWTQAVIPRAIFGQTNFFLSFDASFFRARGYFEIQPASAATP